VLEATYDIESIQVRVDGKTLFSCGSLTILPGQLTAIIGPNGAGKSTLLRALSGMQGQCRGRFAGQPLRPEILCNGRSLAWVAQHQSADSPLSLQDYVLLGRRPHLGRWGQVSAEERQAVAALLAELELTALALRPLASLSGGQRQLAAIARAMVQDAPVILLDEPGNHLDIRYQHRLMGLLSRLAGTGRTVVCVLHDLALAANYADAVLLVAEGAIAQSGAVADVLQAGLLSRMYRWPIQPSWHAARQVWQVDAEVDRAAVPQ
jgi:ABC-type cobalamin/Fe3+-siderophores transport system ATPase subunit